MKIVGLDAQNKGTTKGYSPKIRVHFFQNKGTQIRVVTLCVAFLGEMSLWVEHVARIRMLLTRVVGTALASNLKQIKFLYLYMYVCIHTSTN